MEEWDTSNYTMGEKQDVDSHIKISDLLVTIKGSIASLPDHPRTEPERPGGRFPAGHLTSVY